MKPIKLKVKLKLENYPIIIGSNLTNNLKSLLKKNSIFFNQCLLVIDKNVPKKFQTLLKRKLQNYDIVFFSFNANEKAKSLNANSSEAEVFNVMGQLQSLQRIRKSGELESSYKEREQLEQHGKPKV